MPMAIYARGHNAALAATYALYQLTQAGASIRWYVLRDGFLSYRQFIERPESMSASFTLHTGQLFRNAVYDREIPLQSFVFDVLRHFDLRGLLGSISNPGLVINPIDGDWKRMLEPEARRMLAPGIRLACEADAGKMIEAFRTLLAIQRRLQSEAHEVYA